MKKIKSKEKPAYFIGLKKNPLAQAFGMAIKKLRGDKNSSTIAEKLQVSNSFVRLLETGATNIHSGKTIKILDSFPDIEFEPLSKLLTAIAITDGFKDSAVSYIGILNDLSRLDDQFSLLFEDLIQIIQEIRSEPAQVEKILENRKYPDIVINFLCDPYFGKNKKTDSVDEDEHDLNFYGIIDKTPSIYVDTIINNLKSLSTINPNLFVNDSSTWEKENGSNFIGLIAVIRDFEGIITEENINKFNYKYLKNDDFQYLNFIILNENESAEFWRKQFINILSERWNENLKDGIINKIEIKKRDQNNQDIIEFLQSTSKSEVYDLLWIFITKTGSKVGFVLKDKSKLDGSTETYIAPLGEALSYSAAKNKYNLFKKIWSKA